MMDREETDLDAYLQHRLEELRRAAPPACLPIGQAVRMRARARIRALQAPPIVIIADLRRNRPE
jgi:hypothetical protein